MSKLAYRLAEGQAKDIKIKYQGEISNYATQALKAAVLDGLLENVSEEQLKQILAVPDIYSAKLVKL